MGALRLLTLILSPIVLLVACDATSDPAPVGDGVEAQRRLGVAKGDQSGSCADSCDEQSQSGSCWCDAQCATYGDCCADKQAVCDAPAPSCVGACGGASAAGDCYCDATCAEYGDCCADKAAVCDAPRLCPSIHQPSPEFCPGGQIKANVADNGCIMGYRCEAAPTGCADRCGEQAPEGCWCDTQCAGYGDCCPGLEQACP